MNDSIHITDYTLDEQLELVSNVSAGSEELKWISASQFVEIAFEVIDHPNTDFETLSELSAGVQHGASQNHSYYYQGVRDAAWDALAERFGDYEGE